MGGVTAGSRLEPVPRITHSGHAALYNYTNNM